MRIGTSRVLINPHGIFYFTPSTNHGARYRRYVMEFRKKCQTIKDEYADGTWVGQAEQRWADQLAAYCPDTANWRCGCSSYQESPNHLCKHLIRLCIGEDGLLSNKPPMPFYSEALLFSGSRVSTITTDLKFGTSE